jgi:spore coat polysaccharide biosynthesis protein SpsF (cytidylyltransferase family)
MKPVFFVPIKLQSQRLPNKMLLKLGDKLLCQYIFDILIEVKKKLILIFIVFVLMKK